MLTRIALAEPHNRPAQKFLFTPADGLSDILHGWTILSLKDGDKIHIVGMYCPNGFRELTDRTLYDIIIVPPGSNSWIMEHVKKTPSQERDLYIAWKDGKIEY
jgi:hypothetical protein